MKIVSMLVLAALVGLSMADIGLQPGYNYNGKGQSYQSNQLMHILAGLTQQQQQQQHHQQISSVQMHQITQPSLQYLPNPAPLPAAVPTPLPMPVGFPNVGNFLPQTAGVKSVRRRPRIKTPKKPIVTKNFFIHAAPEESDDDLQEELEQLAAQPRKHYNVLFVKTPSQTSRSAALNLAKALKEEKTVVYVLSKKTSAADLQEAISDAPQHINKPEVFFIKYRTPEEALHAQRQIQTQYDSLGGTSIITDEGVAPVTSVVGSLDAPEEEELDEQSAQQAHAQALPQASSSLDQQQQYDQNLVNSINDIGSQYLPPPNQY